MFGTFFNLLRGKGPRRAHKPRTRLHIDILEDRTVPTLLGQQLFPSDNPWNQLINDAPVASNSTAIINNIISRSGDGRLHPDFGQDSNTNGDLYGIPFNIVHGNSVPKVNVIIDAYPDESDIFAVPLPQNIVLEGDFQNGPRAGLNNRGDSHMIIWDVDNNIAYEFYRASRPSENADGRWHADQQTIWDMKTNTYRTLGWTSADAAGLSILAGLVRPDEALPVSQGGQGVINHAIRFTLQNSIILDQYLYPASHVANPGNNNPAIMPAMGAHFRLKADVDIAHLNPQSRIIAQAMKDYGMILADNGSNFFFSGTSASVDANNNFTMTFNDDDIQDSLHGLKSLRFSNFEVVDLTPIVTDLSVHQGQAGTQVTITGENFTGASGNLHVFFGAIEATNFTIVNDNQIIVTAPTGSGTVDVRVQSGDTVPADPDNVKSTIFGYGISAISAGGRFTFGTSTNAAPTVAQAATASPSTITGTTTNLSVLGADDGGEANLTYTWSVTSKPSGSTTPTFSVNGTNGAKSTTATFVHPGSYTFLVTIRDAQGLTTTSSVTVTKSAPPPANKPPTITTPAKASNSTVTGKTVGLSVRANDDGGAANLTYSWAVVSKPANAADPSFSVNDTNGAKNTTATFSAAGVYVFQVTVRDAKGLSVTSTVTVTVKQVLKTIQVTPTPINIPAGTSFQFNAVALDQFGNAMAQQPTFFWSETGRGTISQSGLYTAPTTIGGPYTIRATAGGITGRAKVTIVPMAPPPT